MAHVLPSCAALPVRSGGRAGEWAVPLNNLSLPLRLGMFAKHRNARGREPRGPSGHRTLRQQSSKQQASQLGAGNDSHWRRPTLTGLRRPTADTPPTRCSTCALLSLMYHKDWIVHSQQRFFSFFNFFLQWRLEVLHLKNFF